MPFSHHSHSGQFCGHASNTLAEMVSEAQRQGMQVFALTEHMPRHRTEELYPAEVEEGVTPVYLADQFAAFYAEARRLQFLSTQSPALLVGAETEWILPATESKAAIEKLLKLYPLDILVGSVHHVHGIPIDYDQPTYENALNLSNSAESAGNDIAVKEDKLFADYFDAQWEMLQAIRPPVVGHFDVIRLLSSQPNRELEPSTHVWEKVVRNLNCVATYGGFLEVNSSGLRKGLQEPYPKKEIVKAFASLGGSFVLSDDSHAVGQVGTNYRLTLQYLDQCGVSKLSFFERGIQPIDERFPTVGTNVVSIKDLLEQWV